MTDVIVHSKKRHLGLPGFVLMGIALALAPRTAFAQPLSDEEQALKLLDDGKVLLEDGYPDKAEALFREAIELVPDASAPHFYLAKALVNQQRCAEAIPELEAYLQTTQEGGAAKEAGEMLQRCREAGASEGAGDDALLAPADEPSRPKGGDGRGLRIAGFTTAGIGVVSIVVGVKFGLDAKDKSDHLSRDTMDAWTDDELALFEKGESDERKMFIFTGIGAAAVVTGGLLYWWGARHTGEKGGTSTVRVAPSLGTENAGLIVWGDF